VYRAHPGALKPGGGRARKRVGFNLTEVRFQAVPRSAGTAARERVEASEGAVVSTGSRVLGAGQ
jgi:hypothetical protein